MSDLLLVICPQGVAAGELVSFVSPLGEHFKAAVPAGVLPGDVFEVDIAACRGSKQAEATPAASPASAIETGYLTQREADALRAILRSLHAFDELDDFVEHHAATFIGYTRAGEQRFEWSQLHDAYVTLVETRIHEHLCEHDLRIESLVALLSRGGSGGGDDGDNSTATSTTSSNCGGSGCGRVGAGLEGAEPLGERFLRQLLSMGDYHHFCAMMCGWVIRPHWNVN